MTPQERLKKIDRFNREWAIEHGEVYQGCEDHIDFVIYKTRKANGMLELRCDNSHLAERKGDRMVSAVEWLDRIEQESAAIDVITLITDRLLKQCRYAWVEEVQKLQQQLAQPQQLNQKRQQALESSLALQQEDQQTIAEMRTLLAGWYNLPQPDVECEFCERIHPNHEDDCIRWRTHVFLAEHPQPVEEDLENDKDDD